MQQRERRVSAGVDMSVENEFATVALILASRAETRGIDAFALSLIKAERQARRLVTHLVYQFPVFGPDDVGELRDVLGRHRRVYFEGFLAGFDALYPRSIRDLVGPEYERLRSRLNEAVSYRNKIFHGQLTERRLGREELVALVKDIELWCTCLARGAARELGYDGFARDSFRKSRRRELWRHYNVPLSSSAEYDDFIKKHMQRT